MQAVKIPCLVLPSPLSSLTLLLLNEKQICKLGAETGLLELKDGRRTDATQLVWHTRPLDVTVLLGKAPGVHLHRQPPMPGPLSRAQIGVRCLPAPHARAVARTDCSVTCAAEENPQVCSAVGNASSPLSSCPTLLCADGQGICPEACIRRHSDRPCCLNPAEVGTGRRTREVQTRSLQSPTLPGPNSLGAHTVGSFSEHRLQSS